jgi:hypothetical protein
MKKIMEKFGEYLSINSKLFVIYNNNIKKFLLERIDEDLSSPNSRSEAKSRLACINVLPKVVNKLSKAYSTQVIRHSENNQDNLSRLITDVSMTKIMTLANKMLNLHRIFAVEIIIDPITAAPSLRVIPASNFVIYSSTNEPDSWDTFIKIIDANTIVKYTNETVETWDVKDNVLRESLPNAYGVIPFVVNKRDTMTTLPEPDRDAFEFVTLLPLLLTDLNYAMKFQAFSIMYTINASSKNKELAPNAIWSFETTGQDGDKPEIGKITPEINASDLMLSVSTQFNLWLDTKNIKMNSIMATSAPTLSGIAKAIDEGDVHDDVVDQRKIFEETEKEIIRMISSFVPSYGNMDDLSIHFVDDSSVRELPKDKLDRIVLKLDKKLTSWEQAVREANESLTESQLRALYAEIRSGNNPDISTTGQSQSST